MRLDATKPVQNGFCFEVSPKKRSCGENGGDGLIDSVLFDPRAPDELCDAMQHYLKEVLKFPGKVRKSKLYTVKSR